LLLFAVESSPSSPRVAEDFPSRSHWQHLPRPPTLVNTSGQVSAESDFEHMYASLHSQRVQLQVAHASLLKGMMLGMGGWVGEGGMGWISGTRHFDPGELRWQPSTAEQHTTRGERDLMSNCILQSWVTPDVYTRSPGKHPRGPSPRHPSIGSGRRGVASHSGGTRSP
jgi:hypothetical protein